MVFIILTGGKAKRLKGKHGGDKFDLDARSRADDRRFNRECKLMAERKSSKREARLLDSEPVLVDTTSACTGEERKLKGMDFFVTEDGNTRVTIRYNAVGMAVCAIIRPERFSR